MEGWREEGDGEEGVYWWCLFWVGVGLGWIGSSPSTLPYLPHSLFSCILLVVVSKATYIHIINLYLTVEVIRYLYEVERWGEGGEDSGTCC